MSEVHAARSNRLFQPSTFEERGTLAPFTTPVLTGSRVRPDDRQGLVLLMPAFGGTPGSYVVPWRAVPDVATLTVHDRALHEEIMTVQATNPDAMRACGLRVAATGLAGPESKAAADTTLQADENQKVETHFFLILRLLQMLKVDHAALMSIDPKSDEWKNATKSMLLEAAKLLKVHIDDVYSRLEEISTLLTPIGLGVLNQAGRLRQLLDAIRKLREEAEAAAANANPEAAEMYSFSSAVADHTVEIAEKLFVNIDRAIENVPKIVGDWTKQRAATAKLIDRISWLLDGWDQALGSWAQLSELEDRERIDQLPYLLRLLPIVPRNEAEDDDDDSKKRSEKVYQTARVKNLEDWRTGKRDSELIARIESARAKAAGSGRAVAVGAVLGA